MIVVQLLIAMSLVAGQETAAPPAEAQEASPRVQRVVELPFEPVRLIVAGDPNGDPPDSPDDRVDPNVPDSDWAGVASLFISHDGQSGYICTATPISRYYILSAGHCVDENDNGQNDFGNNIWVIFNTDGYMSHLVQPQDILAVHMHPDFTGFNNPNINDDVMIIELIYPLPEFIPIYPVYRGEEDVGLVFTAVGYGLSGDGVNGFTVGASFAVKRVGMNVIDMVYEDDNGGPLPEIFAFDFDGPMGNGFWGGPTLGNDLETTFGGGDSGGPSFVDIDGDWQLVGVNTFSFAWNYGDGHIIWQPYFGSGAGGMLITAYLDWIDSIVRDWIPGDINRDGVVDHKDLAGLLASFNRSPGDPGYNPLADINHDGVVDQADLAILLANWGKSLDDD